MTTNKPEVVGYLVEVTNDPDIGAFFVDHEPALRGCVNTPLVRLSDYEALQATHEEELFQVRQDRDTHFGELMRALEQVDALQVECEKLVEMLEVFVDDHGDSSYLSVEEKEAVPVVREARKLIAAHRKNGGEK